MTIYGSVLPGAAGIARLAVRASELSDKARWRLKVLDWHRDHGNNLSLTARHFGIHRRLLREWKRRLSEKGPVGLNDRSRRPHRIRRPTVSSEAVAAVVRWRKEFPAWSKRKIRPHVINEGFDISISTVGRILKRKGLIDRKISRKRARAARSPKARYPRGMKIHGPGDMVQMDTKHIMFPGGRKLYQFTAIDVLTKQRVLEAYSSESSRNGAMFLDQCRREFPFQIGAVQSDNGAPFQKEFQKKCEELGLAHFYTYPRHPKQNSYVEISHGADEREFYQQGKASLFLPQMRGRLKEWQRIWNEVRSHEALNDLTPKQYFERWQTGRLPTKDTITLQT